ncbi:macrodontain-1-like [Daphnia pulex]|uniref:macrodontain-1-like n=1 Tax=Daphnia pulex TaxID=6669 RepID=UPI001EDCC8DB|nr:macrodontain-1-like [Daphnia pulex]
MSPCELHPSKERLAVSVQPTHEQATHEKMKLVNICFLSLAIFVGYSVTQEETAEDLAKFKEFKKRHKKTYNGALERVHFKRWKKRRAVIDDHNNQNRPFLLGENIYSDLSEEEWDTYLLGVKIPKEFVNTEEVVVPPESAVQSVGNRQTLPSLDLRNHTCMPPVKIQSPCGGCWAFIATAAVEFQTCIANNGTKTPLLLSEQQLIDCSSSYGTKGCSGGFYSQAWDYLMAIGGQASNATYPYKAAVGNCSFVKDVTPTVGKISRYSFLAKNETAILTAVQKGPIAVSIVTNSNFTLYKSGIFDDDTCKNGTVNHGVLIVGYGRTNSTDYWIVRNSWGTSWGMSGYIFMKRNVNICRIAEYAFLATI